MAKRSFEPSALETVIGNGLHIKGALTATSNVWVDGIVDGDIAAEGNVVVHKHGQVNGPISAHSISVAGTVRGDITAKEQVIIEPGGNLLGDVSTASLKVAAEATLNGQVTMPNSELNQNQTKS